MICINVAHWQWTKTHCARRCIAMEKKVTWIKIPTVFSLVETNTKYTHLTLATPLWKMSVNYSDILLSK